LDHHSLNVKLLSHHTIMTLQQVMSSGCASATHTLDGQLPWVLRQCTTRPCLEKQQRSFVKKELLVSSTWIKSVRSPLLVRQLALFEEAFVGPQLLERHWLEKFGVSSRFGCAGRAASSSKRAQKSSFRGNGCPHGRYQVRRRGIPSHLQGSQGQNNTGCSVAS
jgi:hypothetical protein